MYAQHVVIFMILHKVTPIQESNQVHLLRHCLMTGFVHVVLLNQCLQRKAADIKSKESDVNGLTEKTHT
jgi:hypothetical protein